MKVVIGYPPLQSAKGVPLLSQNRQFQWFSSPTYIYPLVPASAATLLNNQGHQVVWLDGIAEQLSYSQWQSKLIKTKPDLLFLETKTPVIKQHWQIIKTLKKKLPSLIIVLAGDHVTALPDESLKKCPVDYILQGGNYDLSLLNITKSISKKQKIPQKITSPGLADLNSLPVINRKLSHWQLYAYKNGNYKFAPGTYTMAARDCWWRLHGGCTFCSWTTLYPQFSQRSPDHLLDEIGQLIKLGIKEIFDDSGTFPAGSWLTQFCQGMIKRKYHQKITLGCNMRFGILTLKDYQLMAKANFRLLLFGLESANQNTLNRLNKGIKLNRVIPELKTIQQANQRTTGRLEPHLTCMVGYPWETLAQAQNTVNFTKNLFQQNLITSLQATICIPYPGTKLFSQAQKNHWLKTTDWNQYDMSRPIMKSKIPDKTLHKLTQNIYISCLTPRFILKKLFSIRSLSDLKWFLNAGYKVLAHYLDFL